MRGVNPASPAPANKITIPRSARSFVLSLELENGLGDRSYRATVTDADRNVIWTKSNLKPQFKDTLRIDLDSDLVKAGDYQLTLEGLTREGAMFPKARTASA